MADIINLDARRPEPEFWQCECGCASFFLSHEGYALCAECHTILRLQDAQLATGENLKKWGRAERLD